MFEYFSPKKDEDGIYLEDGKSCRDRLKQKIQNINNRALSGSKADLVSAANLFTIINMAKSNSDLTVPKVYAISKDITEYEQYINEKYFGGMTPEEFENNEEAMKRFNEAKKSYYDSLIAEKDQNQKLNKMKKIFGYLYPLENETYEEYDDRVLEHLGKLKSNKYRNIEKLHAIDNFADIFINDINAFSVINEEIVDVLALISAIHRSNLINYSNESHIDQINHIGEFGTLTNWYRYSILLVFGYNYLSKNNIYDLYKEEKNKIYKDFGLDYNDEFYKYMMSFKKTEDKNSKFDDIISLYDNEPNHERMINTKESYVLNPTPDRSYANFDKMVEIDEANTMLLGQIMNDLIGWFFEDETMHLSKYVELVNNSPIPHRDVMLKLLNEVMKKYGDLPLEDTIDLFDDQYPFETTVQDYIRNLKNPGKQSIILSDLTGENRLSEEAKLWRDMIVDILRNIKKRQVKGFVNNDDLIIGLAAEEKDAILKSAAWTLIYEDKDMEEEYKDKLSYIINR